MASPSNKKTGASYLDRFTKAQLISKYIELTSQLTELEKGKEKIDIENMQLKKQIESLNKKIDRFSTKDEIIKKVLEYKARNLVPITIREKMLLEGFTIELSQVKNIYNGELSLENEAYYKKCLENYIETIRINTKYYKQSSIEEINRLLGYAYENLESCDKEDLKMRMSIMDSISSYIEKRDKLMKNIDEANEMTEEEEIMNETFEEFKNSSDKIIQLINVRAIGGD